MKEEKVIAVDGKEYNKNDCKKIKGVYWKIGDPSIVDSGHCYYINDKYYKYNTGYIVYDYRLKEYVIKNSMLLVENAVVGLDQNGNKVLGSYSKGDYNYNVFLFEKGMSYDVMNPDIFKDSKLYVESMSDGNFYHRQEVDTYHLYNASICSSSYKNSLNYDSRKSLKEYTLLYNKLYNEPVSPNIDDYGNFIKDFTFGVEFETNRGMIPQYITDKLGLIPLRDGSISGLEFATIPLAGKKGLQTLVDICKELNKRTTFDDSCALHVHMGGIPRTEEFFLALFKVLVAIEDEFYSMFPIYKKYNFGIKKKHYTKKFPLNETIMLMDPIINDDNIKQNFAILFKFLSSNQNYSKYENDLRNVEYHPSDPHGESKWNIKSRYFWTNMIPLLFGNKQTVEFRVHTSTLDSNKIINYLIICSSILDYTMKFSKLILARPVMLAGLNIRDIIHDVNEDASSVFFDNINDYMQQRKDYIYQCTKEGNILAQENNFYPHYYIKWEGESRNDYTFKKQIFNPSPGFYESFINNLQSLGSSNINIVNESIDNHIHIDNEVHIDNDVHDVDYYITPLDEPDTVENGF